MKTVQASVGHSNESPAADVYAKPLPGNDRAAADVPDNFLEERSLWLLFQTCSELQKQYFCSS